MMFGEAGSLNLRAGSPHTFDRLITTSSSAGTIISDTLQSGPDAAIRRLSNEGKEHTVAALVRGKLKSAFKPRDGESGWVNQASSDAVVLVASDADFIADQYAVQKIPFANQIIAKPLNDNVNFVINAIDFLNGSEDLIAIRSRGRFVRPFDKLVEIQEKAQAKWKDEENSLQTKLAQTQAKLQEMQGARIEGNRIVLTPEQQSEIEKFRAEESQMRKRLREVRKNLREDIESLGRTLALVNLALVPVGVSVAGGVVFRRRLNRTSSRKKN